MDNNTDEPSITLSYNVCALISGGKDSIYSAMLVKQQGHNIVALANLAPLTEKDDMDSHCFQSVGHNLIPAYSDAMGIPLFRYTTKGVAKYSKLDYHQTNDDEVEDLYQLLLQIVNKKDLNINAICCGAIASTYQYNRVKNVAQRLNLNILTPLWQKNDENLINDIICSGIEAIIVKVSSAGLDDTFVGNNITKSMVSQFSHLKQLYGMNLCGEGGEYESMVLYCPYLFNKRIVINNSTKKYLDKNPYAPVVVLSVDSYTLVTVDKTN